MTEDKKIENSSVDDTVHQTEAQYSKQEPNQPSDLKQILKMALDNPDGVEKLVSLVSKPFAEYKIKELEYKREIEKEHLAIEKAKEASSKHRFWGIVIIIGALIVGAVILFFNKILSGETVAFLFGTLAGCLITFAAKNEKVVVVREEREEEES